MELRERLRLWLQKWLKGKEQLKRGKTKSFLNFFVGCAISCFLSDVFSLGCVLFEMLTGESLGRSHKSLALLAITEKAWKPETLFKEDLLIGESSALVAMCIAMLSLVKIFSLRLSMMHSQYPFDRNQQVAHQ